MLKKTVTYVDYNDVERTEDFYFNLTEPELMEMELSADGGMAEMLKRIVNAKDTNSIMKIFKEIVRKSYGVKSDDGKRFIKNAEIQEEFVQSAAYSKIFMELATNDVAAADFVKGIMPKHISKQISDEDLKAITNQNAN